EVYNRQKLLAMAKDAKMNDHYQTRKLNHFPLIHTDIPTWNEDLNKFMENPATAALNDPFFKNVAQPMFHAWRARKEKIGTGLEQVEKIAAPDWGMACRQWIQRKEQPLYVG